MEDQATLQMIGRDMLEINIRPETIWMIDKSKLLQINNPHSFRDRISTDMRFPEGVPINNDT